MKLIHALKWSIIIILLLLTITGGAGFWMFPLFISYISPFLNFPVLQVELSLEGFIEYNHNVSTTRLILSLIWYSFLLGILSTLPLYQLGYFKNKAFYKAYKKFWQHGAYISAALVTVLNGFIFNQSTYYIFTGIIQFILWYFLTKVLTINVAARQYNEHYPSTD